jgi:hypothetical protein
MEIVTNASVSAIAGVARVDGSIDFCWHQAVVLDLITIKNILIGHNFMIY